MKSLLLTFLSLSLTTAFASVKIEEEVYVIGQSPEVVRDLIQTGSAEVDHVSSEGFELFAAKGLMDYLDSKNIPYMNMKQFKAVLDDYPTHAEMTKKLKAAQAKNPGIIKLFSIGKSIQGQELWVVKISDNVDIDEVEPEFKYISSMHGDEITGREMTTFLIEEIAEKYGKDQEITDLVNNSEIYIMPSMNPDGSALRQRANANSADLNRNFPDIMRDTSGSSMKDREIENQHVMNFQASRKFSLSANFHGGTIVANYPWDSKYDRHPLDGFVKELSSVYSELNPEMISSREFSGGITNGADWYIVKGGMQDWSYFWYNDLQITLEISHTKWPSYSDMPGFYKSNRDSMVEFMKQVHRGAGIKIDRPNISGTVRIKQTSPKSQDLGSYAFSDSEFYKVMPEGEYTFSVKETSGSVRDISVTVEKNSIAKNGNYYKIK